MILKFRVWDKRRKTFRTDIYIDCVGQFFKFSKKTPYGKAITYTNDKNMEISYSTGLKDKNGVEIFEGDIITTIEGMLYKVTKSVSGLWKLIPIEKYHDVYYLTLADVADLMMIIGNIYENPELLEVEE